MSRRIRPTYTSSCPVACNGVGYTFSSGLSNTITPGAFANNARISSGVVSFSKVTLISTECELYTGTRTQVAVTATSSDKPRILRVS